MCCLMLLKKGDYGAVLSVTTSDTDDPSIDFSLTGKLRINPPTPTPEITPMVTGFGDFTPQPSITLEPTPTPVPPPFPKSEYVEWQQMICGSGADLEFSILETSDG
jgi:hypothetical protein